MNDGKQEQGDSSCEVAKEEGASAEKSVSIDIIADQEKQESLLLKVKDLRKDAPKPTPSFRLEKPVFFIGFMGAGKTSVSRRLARICHVTSVDLDAYISRSEGMSIPDIFAARGEENFRMLETKTLDEVSRHEPLLVSCGGGIILREESRTILKERGFVVYLKVSADEAVERISDTSTRPLFKDKEAARLIRADRLPLYEELADVAVDTADKSIEGISTEVKNILLKEGILWQIQK